MALENLGWNPASDSEVGGVEGRSSEGEGTGGRTQTVWKNEV